MNRSDLLLKKRNAPEKRQKRGCCGSTELPIVVATRSWREISCEKLGILIQQTKNSLNFVSTCLKVVDTRRNFILGTTRSGCFDISCCCCDGWKRPAQLVACFLILSSLSSLGSFQPW